MDKESQINELISISMWSIRRLHSPFNRVAMLEELLKTIDENHPYRYEIIKMLDESKDQMSRKKDMLRVTEMQDSGLM